MGRTDSIQEFANALRTHLLTFTDGGPAPASIGAAVSDRFWHNRPAASVGPLSYPYALLTVSLLPPEPEMDWHRRGVMAEVMIVDRPGGKLARARRLADLAGKGLSQWDVASATDGSVRFRPPLIDDVSPNAVDGDRGLVQVRVMADSGYSWWAGGERAADVHQDLIDALGDASVLGFYVTTDGQTGAASSSVQHSAGVVNEWWDYRGETGFGPKLTGSGTGRPAWDSVALEIEADGIDDWVGSATSALYALNGAAKSVVFVGTFEGASDSHPVAIVPGGGSFDPMLGLHRHNVNGNIASQHYPGNVRIDSGIAGGAAVRVAFASKNATTTGAVEVPNDAQETGVIAAAGGGNNKLVLFTYTDPGASFSGAKARAVIVLNRAHTSSDRDLIKAWAVEHLDAVLV